MAAHLVHQEERAARGGAGLQADQRRAFRRSGRGSGAPLDRRDERGEGGEGRGLEQEIGRQRHAERLTQAGAELHGHQRAAAQVEEIVVGVHPLDAEEVAPDAGDHRLERIGRPGGARAGGGNGLFGGGLGR